MSILQLDSSDLRIVNNHKSDPNPETSSSSNLCQICFATNQTNKKFADCDHTKICLKCARDSIRTSLDQGKYPVCLNQNCRLPMIKRSKSLYDYFDNNLKQKIKDFQQNIPKSEQRAGIPCKYPDCEGTLDKHRCKKCLRLHCETCEQIQHSPFVKCPVKNQLKLEGLNQCPNCREGYTKETGCNHITCIKCKFQFCNVCFEAWSKLHHLCGDKNNKDGESSTYDSSKRIKQRKSARMGCCGLSESCQLF